MTSSSLVFNVPMWLAAAGFSIAFLSGLVGIGGGVLMVPLLLYVPPLLGMSPIPGTSVAALGAVQIASAGLSGTLAHRLAGNLDLRLWRRLAFGGIAGGLAGALVSPHLDESGLRVLFAVAVTAAAAIMNLPTSGDVPDESRDPGFLKTAMTGAAIGSFIGLIGAGVFLVVPACIFILGTGTRTAVASANAFGLVLGIAVSAVWIRSGKVEPSWILGVLAGGLVGAPIGARFSRKVTPKILRRIFGALVLLIALRLWVDVLGW